MDLTHGGRATLRLGAISSTEVEYNGELATREACFTSKIRVAIADGSVEICVDGDAPAWLLELVRTTLRAAWRARLAGVQWPRRVSRWRATKDEGRA